MPADCGSARLWTTEQGKTTFETRLALGLSLALLTRFISSSFETNSNGSASGLQATDKQARGNERARAKNKVIIASNDRESLVKTE